jgi:hypothetical protein
MQRHFSHWHWLLGAVWEEETKRVAMGCDRGRLGGVDAADGRGFGLGGDRGVI